jgi:hypothetical protein
MSDAENGPIPGIRRSRAIASSGSARRISSAESRPSAAALATPWSRSIFTGGTPSNAETASNCSGVGNAAIATPATSTGRPCSRARRSRTAAACRVFHRSDSTHDAAAS